MRLATIAESFIERILLRLGLVPTPIMDTLISFMLARAVMIGTKFGVFDALAASPLAAEDVAERCKLDRQATDKLLFALAGAGYLRVREGKYALAPVARRWLLEGGAHSLREAVLHRYLDIKFMEHGEEFMQTGQPLNFHETLTPEEWGLYQRGQREGAMFSAPEVARRAPVPANPRAMLDIGGAHGYYSVALCRRHPGLRSTILDLPGAVEQSAPILAKEGMGDRVRHRAGNALTDELGVEAFDLVFIANLVHHFDDAANRDLMRRVARSLKPGGFCVILELIRHKTPEKAGQIGSLMGFFFAVTSASGTWSFEEMADWQRAAGLAAQRPISLRMSPGFGLQAAKKV